MSPTRFWPSGLLRRDADVSLLLNRHLRSPRFGFLQCRVNASRKQQSHQHQDNLQRPFSTHGALLLTHGLKKRYVHRKSYGQEEAEVNESREKNLEKPGDGKNHLRCEACNYSETLSRESSLSSCKV
jgi:hypothetical protein